MGRKLGLTLADVVDAAATIADDQGLAAATPTAVAQRLGIATPSLYNHVSGVGQLRRLLAIKGARLLGEVFSQAAVDHTGSDALRAAAYAYRSFAAEHRGLYEALLPAPRPGQDDELAAAMAEPVAVLAGVLTVLGADASQTVHLVRGLRSAVHGFVTLERDNGFGMPVDIDASFDVMVDLVIAGIEATIRGGGRRRG